MRFKDIKQHKTTDIVVQVTPDKWGTYTVVIDNQTYCNVPEHRVKILTRRAK